MAPLTDEDHERIGVLAAKLATLSRRKVTRTDALPRALDGGLCTASALPARRGHLELMLETRTPTLAEGVGVLHMNTAILIAVAARDGVTGQKAMRGLVKGKGTIIDATIRNFVEAGMLAKASVCKSDNYIVTEQGHALLEPV